MVVGTSLTRRDALPDLSRHIQARDCDGCHARGEIRGAPDAISCPASTPICGWALADSRCVDHDLLLAVVGDQVSDSEHVRSGPVGPPRSGRARHPLRGTPKGRQGASSVEISSDREHLSEGFNREGHPDRSSRGPCRSPRSSVVGRSLPEFVSDEPVQSMTVDDLAIRSTPRLWGKVVNDLAAHREFVKPLVENFRFGGAQQ